MTVVLRYHPFTRAAGVTPILEEVGVPYELDYVDLLAGEHKQQEHKRLNAMGKLPTLIDGDAVISEVAAIGMYLADRYAPGRMAPALDDPRRGPYLRWCVYGPSVVEPCTMARSSKWEYSPASAGFGTYDEMMDTLVRGVGDGPWLLGDQFTVADQLLGGTVAWLQRFGMLEQHPVLVEWVSRVRTRPAHARGLAVNERIIEERGLTRG